MKKFETILIVLIIIAFILSLFIQGEGYKSDIRDLEQKVSFTESKHKKLKAKTSVELKSSHEKIKTLEDEYNKLEKSKADDAKALNNQIDELHAKVNEVQGQLDEKSGELDRMKKLGFGRGGGDAVVETKSTSIKPFHDPSNLYSPGYCTYFVKNVRADLPNNLGNANQWASRASAMGLPVGSEPSVGAVATTTRGYYGHVGYVKAVDGDRVLISEMNAKGLWVVSEDWYSKSHFEAYIY